MRGSTVRATATTTTTTREPTVVIVPPDSTSPLSSVLPPGTYDICDIETMDTEDTYSRLPHNHPMNQFQRDIVAPLAVHPQRKIYRSGLPNAECEPTEVLRERDIRVSKDTHVSRDTNVFTPYTLCPSPDAIIVWCIGASGNGQRVSEKIQHKPSHQKRSKQQLSAERTANKSSLYRRTNMYQDRSTDCFSERVCLERTGAIRYDIQMDDAKSDEYPDPLQCSRNHTDGNEYAVPSGINSDKRSKKATH